MFIPGAVDAIGAGVDRGPGVIVIPGIGAIVGAGVLFFGAGVDVGIPGIGAMVDWAATPGVAVVARKTDAATTRRKASKGTFWWDESCILRSVVRLPLNAGSAPSVSRVAGG
jgi:hypothetical protein